MGQDRISRGEVIIAGIGGMGVLVAGQVLLNSAFQLYKHVSYVPTYGFAKRGGLCQSTVIFSDEKITSPLVDQAQTVIILDSSQFKGFEPRVRPGGFIIVEQTGLNADRDRDDYTLCALPGLEIAVSLGSTQVNNLILLGAYIKLLGAIPEEIIEGELRRKYQDNEKIMARNLEAFRRGLELGKSAA